VEPDELLVNPGNDELVAFVSRFAHQYILYLLVHRVAVTDLFFEAFVRILCLACFPGQ
jgi:hypothetical protein